MPTELLVDFNEFCSRLREDIAGARRLVFVQTFAFEGDSVGKQLAAALASSSAPDKRVLADSFTRIVLSDRFKYSPANFFDRELRNEAHETATMISELKQAGVQIGFTNPYGLSPRKLLSRNHKKLIIIDHDVAYLGGINFSEHNAAWHDMMLRIDNAEAVDFLSDDFAASWNGEDRLARELTNDLELFTLDGRRNRPFFQRVLDLIDEARDSIFVESPYITFPFYEHLRDATRRGVDVKIVTPKANNWSYFANYARLESARSQIDLRLYRDGMSHLKAMLIDDEYLVAGSSNFDYFSYRIYQEIVAVFTDAHLIADFRERVMLPDLANSVAVDCHASELSKQWLGVQMRMLDAAMTILT
ncbi:MAG: phosphatidylserine/phosphatidylglycerophosphate/cardiolipin synthase family protein [Acidobacteria bacterium]|nr:MAG: phosphatidylserine/phosphatidylglycerophosphate/cardiolipin synthase family protein [Acidobacteriota bacterium]